MTRAIKPAFCFVQWWIWNGAEFERHDLEVQPVHISKCPKYRFFRVKSPLANPISGREWLVAEGGTGYVLAYGTDKQGALRAARRRFLFEHEGICQADVTQYIQGHVELLDRFAGNTPGYFRPVAGAGIRPLMKCGEMLLTQMI